MYKKIIKEKLGLLIVLLLIAISFTINNNAYAFFDNNTSSSSVSNIQIGTWRDGTPGLEYTLSNGEYQVSLGTAGEEEVIIIPEFHQGQPVTSVTEGMFEDNTNVREVIFFANIAGLGSQEFRNATALEVVTFTYEIEDLGNQVFRGTSSFVSLYLEGNENIVPSTHNLTFRDSGLQDVYVPSNMVSNFEQDGSFSDFNIIGL